MSEEGEARWDALRFDWNRARAFLVTAEAGSLSAAARALGLTQPTLGRQVSALEEDLGVTLFQRVGRGLALTEAGQRLLDHVKGMGDAAAQLSLAASGQSQEIAGEVAITASDLLSVYRLPPVLERLREHAPQLAVRIVASNEIRDLRRGEADIAIRHVRPDQPDLIARHVRDASAQLYAAPAYLERHGRPSSLADLADAVFVIAGEPERYLDEMRKWALPVTEANLRYRTQSVVVAWELTKRGFGITIMSDDLGDRTPEVEKLLPEFAPIPVPHWIVTHRELRTSPRIRLVFDALTDAFAEG